MVLDTRLALQTKGIDGLDVYNESLKLADTWLKRQTQAELDKIKKQTLDITDPESRFGQMVGLAKQSKRSKWLIDELNAEKAASEQAQLEQRQKLANIDKTISEQNKNNASASETVQKTGQARFGMLRPVYEALAAGGGIQMASNTLNRVFASGAIDENTYQALQNEFATWGDLSDDEIEAMGMAYVKGMLPAEYLHTTADNVLDNQTSSQNSQRDSLTSRINNENNNNTELQKAKLNAQVGMYGHGVDEKKAELGYKADMAELAYKQQQELFAKSKPVEHITNENGELVAIFADGTGRVVIDKDGKPIKQLAKDGTAGKNSPQAEAKRMKEMDLAISEARDLIKKSTGSFVGNMVDGVVNAFGKSTEGSKAIRQLQVIAGRLISAQPRMEGPQSNIDVELYKQMAGDIANPNIPIKDRLAALDTLEMLNQKYANVAGVQLSGQSKVNHSSAFF